MLHGIPLVRPFSRLCFFVVFLLLLGSLLTALWDPLCSFWHPSGSYWDPFGTLPAHIGTLLVPFCARFGLFCTLGGLLLARFGRNLLFKGEICKKHSCIDPGIKFLANFRMQTIFPRPGGGTIAAGNRDRPSERHTKRMPKGSPHLCDLG